MVLHLWVQPTRIKNSISNQSWESKDVDGQLYALFYAFLHKGLEYLQILLSAGSHGTNVPQMLRDNCPYDINCHIIQDIFYPETFTHCGSRLAYAGDRIRGEVLMVNYPLSNYYMFIVCFLPLEWTFLGVGTLYCLALRTMPNTEQPFHRWT